MPRYNQPRRTWRYTEEFKAKAVLLSHLDGVQVKEVAARNRIRPIFMFTLTSVFGILPLVFSPGAGSELYRGLGSVVIGDLALSAIILPLPLLSLTVGLLEGRRGSVLSVGE